MPTTRNALLRAGARVVVFLVAWSDWGSDVPDSPFGQALPAFCSQPRDGWPTGVQMRQPHDVLYHSPIGRLGNQLFQYASLVALAHKHGMIPCFGGIDLIPWFDGVEGGCKAPGGIPTVGEAGKFATFNDFSFNGSTMLGGYLQSYKYFEHDRNVNKIAFKKHVATRAEEIVRPFREAGARLVGVHVRRGDLAHQGYIREPPAAYFGAAMRKAGAENALFVIVSDDTPWCMSQDAFAAGNVKILDGNRPAAVDMAVLAACDHVIMSIGTFGWWAAYLGPGRRGGRIIYYDSEFVMTHAIATGNVKADDYYPAEWIAVGVSGPSVDG